MSNFQQIVVWRGLVLSASEGKQTTKEDIEDFEKYFDKEMNYKIG